MRLTFVLSVLLSTSVFGALALDPPLGLGSGGIRNDQVSASTVHQAGHNACGAVYGRLNSNLGAGGWCAQTNSRPDFLEVDLRGVATVTAVATQGRNPDSQHYRGARQWVTRYTVQYSLDGASWNWITTPQGAQVQFTGNHDSNSIKTNTFAPTKMRYIRILPTGYHSHKSMRAEIYGKYVSRDPLGLALGMENEKILDRSISASTTHNCASCCNPEHARLNSRRGAGSWCAATNSAGQYLQVDLQGIVELSGVATQARNPSSVSHRGAQQWVKTYKLSYSLDGTVWKVYEPKENGGPRIFRGNTDSATTIRQTLERKIQARYVRIIVLTWRSHISMRAEFYGKMIKKASIGKPLGMHSGRITDDQITSSSTHPNEVYSPKNGRLNTNTAAGSWCTWHNRVGEWMQVDFRGPTTINGIATQGRHNVGQWVTEYDLQWSIDGMHWITYERGDHRVRFKGNTDWSSVVYHTLIPEIHTRYIRVRPLRWHSHTSMRVEFYGTVHRKMRLGSAVGLEQGLLPGSAYKASSIHNGHWQANRARLNYRPYCWLPRHVNHRDWVQVDLGRNIVVGGVATQGRPGVAQWTKSYTISYSTDGHTWTYYQEGGVVKQIQGSADAETVAKRVFIAPFLARYVRWKVVSYHSFPAFRLEVYREDQRNQPSLEALGNAMGVSKGKFSLRGSSVLDGNTDANQGRLRNKNKGGAWCARSDGGRPGGSSYLQIDLGSVRGIGGVSTQGRSASAAVRDPRQGSWVTSFRIEYSNRGFRFTPYKEQGIVREFTGNLDTDSVVTSAFHPDSPIKARFIRIVPLGGRGQTCLRVELYNSAGEEEAIKIAEDKKLKDKIAAEKKAAAAAMAKIKAEVAKAKAQTAADTAAARAAAQKVANDAKAKVADARNLAKLEAAKRAAAEQLVAASKVSVDEAKRVAEKAKQARDAAIAAAKKLAAEKKLAEDDADALHKAHEKARADLAAEAKEKAKAIAEADDLRKQVQALEARKDEEVFAGSRFLNILKRTAALEEMIRQMRIKHQKEARSFDSMVERSKAKDAHIERLQVEIRSWKARVEEAKRKQEEMLEHIHRQEEENALAAQLAAKNAASREAARLNVTVEELGKDEKPEDDGTNGPDSFPKPEGHVGSEGADHIVPSVTRADVVNAEGAAKNIVKSDAEHGAAKDIAKPPAKKASAKAPTKAPVKK